MAQYSSHEALLGAAIILAAGKSSRMGREKSLITIGGYTLLQRHIMCYSAIPSITHISVVVNPQNCAKINSELANYGCDKAQCIINPEESDQLSSLKAALHWMSKALEKVTFFFITPVDCLAPEHATIHELCSTWSSTKCDAIIPCFQSRGGHPTVVNSEKIELILSFNGNGGLKELMSTWKRVIRLPTNDAAVCSNFNYEANIHQFLNQE